MGSNAPLSIVVLYSHALLGEGIGRLLASEPEVRVAYVSCGDPDPLGSVARHRPEMLVVERGGGIEPAELLDRFPGALVIDIGLGPGPTCVYRRQEIPGDPAAILQLVRRLGGGHPSVAIDEGRSPQSILTLSPR